MPRDTITVADEMRLQRPANEELGDGDPDMIYQLTWAGDRRSRDVRLVDGASGH